MGFDLDGLVRGSQSLVVYDLEASCWRGVWHRRKETIEIGAVGYRRGAPHWEEFHTYVRPVRIPKLSRFCTELTGITQEQVDGAPTFPQALASFLAWAGGGEVTLASWGPYDAWQLGLDLEYHQLEPPPVHHLDVKTLFNTLMGVKRRSFAEAAASVGLELEGRRHSALHDARNTARMLDRLLDRAATP